MNANMTGGAPPTQRADVTASRITVLFGIIVVTSVLAGAISVVSYIHPLSEEEFPTYADISDKRGYTWGFFELAGVQLLIGVVALSLAGLLLARDRGARWATVGACLIWLGAAMYGVGIGGWAIGYFIATDDTLGPAVGTRLVDRMNDDVWHVLAVPITGALLVGLGSIVMVVGIWQAGTVPRWLLVVLLIVTVLTIVVPPGALLGTILELVSAATSIMLGRYAWLTRREPAATA